MGEIGVTENRGNTLKHYYREVHQCWCVCLCCVLNSVFFAPPNLAHIILFGVDLNLLQGGIKAVFYYTWEKFESHNRGELLDVIFTILWDLNERI